MVDDGQSRELFDVVDEQDCVVGTATRAEVHANGLRHRAVHVLVFNASGRLFLQKRSMNKDTWPGAWDSSASGHVASGESYDKCAARELEEELGFRPTQRPARWFRLSACKETGREFVWVYRLEAGGPFALNRDEIERGAWMAPHEIARRLRDHPEDYAPAFRLIWRKLAARGEVPL